VLESGQTLQILGVKGIISSLNAIVEERYFHGLVNGEAIAFKGDKGTFVIS